MVRAAARAGAAFWTTVAVSVLAALSVGACAFLVRLSLDHFNEISDIGEFAVVARLMAEGRGSDVYDIEALAQARRRYFPSMRERGIGVYCPPPALPLMLPLALVPPRALPAFWLCVQVSLACLAADLIRRAFSLSLRNALWLVAVLAFSGPLFESLRIGQLSTVLLLSVSGASLFLRRGQPAMAGAALALFVLKPQEAVGLLLYFCGCKRWPVVALFAGLVSVLTIGAFLLVGAEGFLSYARLIANLEGNSNYMVPEISPTLRGQILRLGGADGTLALPAGQLFAALGALACFLLGRRFAARSDWWLAGIMAALPIGLASTLFFHFYDLLILAPSAVALLSGCSRIPGSRLARAAVFLGLVLTSIPLYLWLHFFWILRGGSANPYFLALAFYASAAAMLALRSDAREGLCWQGWPEAGGKPSQ